MKAQFFKQIYESKNTTPADDNFKFLFDPDSIKTLESEECDSCESLLTLKECTKCDLTQENVHYALSVKWIKAFFIRLLSVTIKPFKQLLQWVNRKH